MRPSLLNVPWRSLMTRTFWIAFAFSEEFEAIRQTSCVVVALVIGH